MPTKSKFYFHLLCTYSYCLTAEYNIIKNSQQADMHSCFSSITIHTNVFIAIIVYKLCIVQLNTYMCGFLRN